MRSNTFERHSSGMGILVIATIFIGLALLAAVPLVALLHWSDR
jgi:hypothetical protein